MYPGIVNVDIKPKDNSEEQYMFIQNHMYTQELNNDEDEEEYESNRCASSDHEHGKCKTDDEEYESDHCVNSDDENGGHKMMMKSMRWMVVIVVTMKMKMVKNKMDENDMVSSTLSVSPSGLTESSKVDLRLDTVLSSERSW